VTCDATDNAENTGSKSFDITVLSTTSVFPITLGGHDVVDQAAADAIFASTMTNNMHDKLAAELLETKIGIAQGASSCVEVNDAIDDADTILSNADYTGPDSTKAPKGKDKANADHVRKVLIEYNLQGCK